MDEIHKAGRKPEAHRSGYLDPEYGLVVGYAHGPKNFVMHYEEPSVEGAALLNTNPWIDFSGETPQLLD